MAMATRTVPAGRFKQGCLALLDEVAEQNMQVVVTKRGRPVARVVPILESREQEAAILLRMRTRVHGTIGRSEDLMSSSSKFTRWKLKP
jgi:prevent-host-death family protein